MNMNNFIIEGTIAQLADSRELYSFWVDEKKNERSQKNASLEKELTHVIWSYLPKHHKKMVVLGKSCIEWVDLDTMSKYPVLNEDLQVNLFSRMGHKNAVEQDWGFDFGSLLNKISKYPSVYGAVANERFLAWCLELSNGTEGLAWYIVDMLNGWTVKRVSIPAPEQLCYRLRDCSFLSDNKIFCASVQKNFCENEVKMTVIELLSGTHRDLGTLNVDLLDLVPQDKFDYAPVEITHVAITQDQTWVTLTQRGGFIGGFVWDGRQETVIESKIVAKLIENQIVPSKASFFVEEVGFFCVDSLNRIAWFKLDGQVVVLECSRNPTQHKFGCIERVRIFGDDVYFMATQESSMSHLGESIKYLTVKCDISEFVDQCSAVLKESEFVWPTVSHSVSSFLGSFCLC